MQLVNGQLDVGGTAVLFTFQPTMKVSRNPENVQKFEVAIKKISSSSEERSLQISDFHRFVNKKQEFYTLEKVTDIKISSNIPESQG